MANVVVYSTKTCPWCDRLREWLKQHKIEFEEKDVETDSIAAADMVEKSGQQGVPVTEVNGTIIVGFDVEALKKALKIKK